MRPYFLIGCVLMLASCVGNGRNNGADTLANDTPDHDTAGTGKLSMPAQNMEYCFVHTDGTAGQDTTAVHLVINGNKVNGQMEWVPKEKDKRTGVLKGTLSGNKISAVWRFSQEGQIDTMSVEFKLASQQLGQKPYKTDTKTGRQFTDASADYTVNYALDNCSKYINRP